MVKGGMNYEVKTSTLNGEETDRLLQSVMDIFYRLSVVGDFAFPYLSILKIGDV